MTDKPLTEEAIRKACEPKSDQLNYEDVQHSPRTYCVLKATEGDSEKPVFVYFEGEPRPYKPCKTMLRVLKAAWGTRSSDWIGKRVELYGDPSVKWGGVEVGGIKISKVSGIDAPLDLMLTVTRGKRAPHHVEPLPEPKPEVSRTEWFRGWLAKKELPEADAVAAIGGRTLDEATDEDWAALKVWMKQFAAKAE